MCRLYRLRRQPDPATGYCNRPWLQTLNVYGQSRPYYLASPSIEILPVLRTTHASSLQVIHASSAEHRDTATFRAKHGFAPTQVIRIVPKRVLLRQFPLQPTRRPTSRHGVIAPTL